MDAWVERELDGGVFPDERLKTRLGALLGDLGRSPGGTIPAACRDWAATKAAYRFLDNGRIDDGVILAGHFAATAGRFAEASGTVLVLHDTCEFSFRRECPDGVGTLSIIKGRHADHTVCGLLTHSSLALTTAGLPLGLAAVKFWSRREFKGTNARKRSINPTRVPIEEKESYRWIESLACSTRGLGDPARCVHVCDREGDIFELFGAARDERTHFLVRAAVDRCAGRGKTTMGKKMARDPVRGEHRVEVRDRRGEVSVARLSVRFGRMIVHAPAAKRGRYPALPLTVIHATERGKPAGRDPIRWKLLTDLPVGDMAAAVEKLDWYALRWRHEMYQADCPSSRGWVCQQRIGYHRRDGVARTGRVVPATSR